MKAIRISDRPMNKVNQLADKSMIKERGMSNKLVAKPMLMDKKHTIKANRLIRLLKDLLNSGVNKLKEKHPTMAGRLMIKAEKM